MISALDALALPKAQLSADELKALDQLDSVITEAVQTKMGLSGINIVLEGLTNTNIVAAMNQRLRQLGWGTNWQPIMKQHALNRAAHQHVGYTLELFPSDEAHNEFRKKSAH